VDEQSVLARRFEDHSAHLRGVAYRMLGSRSEADDAVQEAWLRLNRSDTVGVNNLAGWLTTVVARVCLDMLRARKSRREECLHANAPQWAATEAASDPEHEMLLAQSVELALLVVLETLTPAERIVFVLHDMFDMPFEAIAPVVGRSPIAARQLASRARRRVRGAAAVPEAELARQRRVVDAFLAASRSGDFNAPVALLDPDIVLSADRSPAGVPIQIRGASAVAKQALAHSHNARFARPALVNGVVGVIVAAHGRLSVVLGLKMRDASIAELHVMTDPAHLRQLDLAVLSE